MWNVERLYAEVARPTLGSIRNGRLASLKHSDSINPSRIESDKRNPPVRMLLVISVRGGKLSSSGSSIRCRVSLEEETQRCSGRGDGGRAAAGRRGLTKRRTCGNCTRGRMSKDRRAAFSAAGRTRSLAMVTARSRRGPRSGTSTMRPPRRVTTSTNF